MKDSFTRPTFIDLFAGCGGLSLGLTKSNFQGLLAIEKSPDAFETFRANFLSTPNKKQKFDWPNWLPKKNLGIADLLEHYSEELKRLEGNVDLIAGGPPCQGFSYAGRREKNDPRNLLVEEYLELVKIVKPRFVLIENVNGITVGHGRGGKKKRGSQTCGESTADRIMQALDIEYFVKLQKLNAKNFGVPQSRERYFFIGIKRDYLESAIPTKLLELFNPFDQVEQERKKFLKRKKLYRRGNVKVTVGEAISDLAVSEIEPDDDFSRFKKIRYKRPEELSQYQRIMRGRLNGTAPCSLRLANHRPMTVKRFEDIMERCEPGKTLSEINKKELGIKKISIRVLGENLPSGTITTLPDDQLHYAEPRILTVREQARLQAFPDSFKFKGKYTTGGNKRKTECPRYSQVGNAVPPFLGEVIGRALIKIVKVLHR